MFNSISWPAYFEFIFFALLPYYAVVILVYYRKDIQLKFTQYQQWTPKESSVQQPVVAKEPVNETNENKDVLFSSVHDLLEEFKIVFQYAADKQFKKEELLFALQGKLINYQPLHGTSFQAAVDEHILEQAALKCEIVLDSEDIKQIW